MSDYNFLMESRLSPEQFQVLTLVSRAAVEQGLNLYLVGGAVRDLTHGQHPVHDLDFVTEGNPQRILRRLETLDHSESRTPRVQGTGERPPLQIESISRNGRLNSAEVQFSNGARAKIAMSRIEIRSKPGRPPEIAPAMVFEDLKRRDFSVNAMAVSLHPNSRGLLLDPTNGAADIEKHELRVMHSRSFSDDPTRIYRLLRLGLRLGFKPEERTRAYLETALENRLWERLSPEEQGAELMAILREENPGRVFKMLAERGLLAGLDMKLSPQKIPIDRFTKIRAVYQSSPGADPFLVNFHCLVEKLPLNQKSRLAKKIIGDSKTIRTALSMEHDARKLGQALSASKNALPSRFYKLLVTQPKNILLYALVYFPQTKLQNKIKSFLYKFPMIRARVPRAELQEIGMKPGPKFEKIIDQVFLDQLDGKFKTPQQIIKQLRLLSGIKEPPPLPPSKPAKTPKTAAMKPAAKAQKQIETRTAQPEAAKVQHVAAPAKSAKAEQALHKAIKTKPSRKIMKKERPKAKKSGR